ncbi:cation:proton antiporter [Candidatus Uhrbacteria bacterium]|nr:cation:proton antiporter [Candidatus Uhrbacteria bacterium]
MSLESLFFEIGGVIVAAAGLSFLAHLLRQPMIIAYILAGLVVGPSVLAFTKSSDVFVTLSQIGVAFLLFTVGLGLNWNRIREVGLVALASGLGQVLFTSLVGFLVGLGLGFDVLTAVFISVAFSFSSTIIIIKLLMDKDELDALYGKIAVGFLLVQDMIAMMILLFIGSLKPGMAPAALAVSVLFKGAVVILFVWLLAKYVAPRLVRFAATSQELLLLFALGWCFAIAGVLVYFGFSVEMGALLAGVSLSGTLFEREINARIRPLRDFFLVLFFIVLGTHLPFENAAAVAVPALVFCVFILVGNPLIMLLVMRGLGYHPKTGFLAGTTVAQISEFSFIMLGAGAAAGYVDASALTLATFVGIVTIGISTYVIKYNEQLYDFARPVLRWLERDRGFHEEHVRRHAGPHTILFGCHRMGMVLLDEIRKLSKQYLVVDFDPHKIEELAALDVPAVYGDAGDEDLLEDLRIERAKLVISTIPDVVVSKSLLAYLRMRDYRGTAIVTVKHSAEAAACYAAGATYVIVPSILGARKFQELLLENKGSIKKWEHCREGECKKAEIQGMTGKQV